MVDEMTRRALVEEEERIAAWDAHGRRLWGREWGVVAWMAERNLSAEMACENPCGDCAGCNLAESLLGGPK